MEPIINPWMLYAISLISSFGSFMILIFALSILVVAIACLVVALDGGDDFEPMKNFCKSKLFIIVFCISLVCSIFIPNQKMMLAMYFSTYITTDNLDSAGATAVTTLTTAIKTALEDKGK